MRNWVSRRRVFYGNGYLTATSSVPSTVPKSMTIVVRFYELTKSVRMKIPVPRRNFFFIFRIVDLLDSVVEWIINLDETHYSAES